MSYSNRRFYRAPKPETIRKRKLENWGKLRKILKDDKELRDAFALRKNNGFILTLFEGILKWGRMTDKQKNALVVAMMRHQKEVLRKKNLENAPSLREGKLTVKGKVISIKERHTPYGWMWKMVVESASGNRIWGSVPNNIIDNLKVGDVVKFTATIKMSNKDDHFGFFRRPSNAEILES